MKQSPRLEVSAKSINDKNPLLLPITKDSIIVVPKIVTKWVYQTKEKETDNSLVKKDTIAFNRTETRQISIVDKNKVITQEEQIMQQIFKILSQIEQN